MMSQVDWKINLPQERKMNYAKYLVCRTDGIRPHGSMKSSDLWPVVVNVQEGTSPEQIVREAFRIAGWGSYRPQNKSYVVVPMADAEVISFVPRQDFDVFIRNYDECN